MRPRSASDLAGLQVGDRIIKFAGRSILDDDAALPAVLQQDRLQLTVRGQDGTQDDLIITDSRR